jgi:transposase
MRDALRYVRKPFFVGRHQFMLHDGSDQSIALDGFYTKQDYPQHLRRVSFRDPETGLHLVFLTNNFTLSATMIAALYKKRWAVELFFKWIKAKFTHQAFLRHFRERRENSNLDCRLRLRARRHHKNRFGARRLALHFFTGFVGSLF